MLSVTRSFILFICTLTLSSGVSYGAASDWAKTDHTQLRIISQTNGTGDTDTLTLGLHFKLNDHWKIYWRSPGDAGFPPSVGQDGSYNVQSTEISWPLPERFSILGFETLGYTNEVVLPLKVIMDKAGDALALNAQISYLACAEICIPYDTELAFSLPAGPATPSEEAHLINRFQSTVPTKGENLGLRIDNIQFRADKTDPTNLATLYLSASSQSPFQSPDAYIEGPEGLAFEKPKVSISSDGKRALMEIGVSGLKYAKATLDQAPITITLADHPRGAEFNKTPVLLTADMKALVETQSSGVPAGPSMLVMLALAVLGGVILNLMPCVLPVLSIKLLGVVGHGGSDTRTVRMSFLASAAGIISSFLVLALALVVLKNAGLAIGWGIQFQHPWFLVAMALVVTLFACNLWGFFEVHLPSSVSEIGESTTHVHGLGGHFMTGALATLLATPCSAPFLGTAVGFALARGTFEIMAIFAALGVGLALPYLLVALRPSFATKMPKPGKWMVILRRILGFALAGTGVWLVSILAIQVSQYAAILIGSIMVVIATMIYVHKRLHRRYGRLDWGAVAILSVLAFAVPDTVANGRSERAATPKLEGLWTPFDQKALREHVKAGKVVFVDVTAEWCITCQVNKAVVIGNEVVYQRLSSSGTIAMQADWTRPSSIITQYLSSFGRYGIPFNAVYGPGAPDGIALPELLSQSEVLKALDTAGSGAMAVGKARSITQQPH
ncbi:MAG: protein-disulfide reductase DsbD family protein [Magnetovibrio sp.]|nr:protein-disulfide reductase DsbD family protein [Magnetovibrio sp.]